MIYSAPDYAMGAADKTAPVTPAEKAKAEVEIRRMKGALSGWLKYRRMSDEVATGQRKGKVPPGLARKILSEDRDWALEQRLATRLHVLLSEMFDASQLPDPNVQKDPDAAVKLAQIAIAGKLPAEASKHSDVGLIWLWPAVVVVGLVLVTVVMKIRSDAALAEEKARLDCVKVGACTDSGFWLKVGAFAVLGWLAWDKFGLREIAGRARGRARGGAP